MSPNFGHLSIIACSSTSPLLLFCTAMTKSWVGPRNKVYGSQLFMAQSCEITIGKLFKRVMCVFLEECATKKDIICDTALSGERLHGWLCQSTPASDRHSN